MQWYGDENDLRILDRARRFAPETHHIRGTLAYTQLDQVATLWTQQTGGMISPDVQADAFVHVDGHGGPNEITSRALVEGERGRSGIILLARKDHSFRAATGRCVPHGSAEELGMKGPGGAGPPVTTSAASGGLS